MLNVAMTRSCMARVLGRRTRCAALLVAGLTVMVGGCDSSPLLRHAFNGVRLATPIAKPAVVWQRTDGSSYDVARETTGRVTLLYFGYMHCPDVCPVQLMNIAQAFRTLGPDTTAQLRMLFVTLDPARDTADVLRSWLREYHPEFIALRAPLSAVNDEAARLKLLPTSPEDSVASAAGPTHASAVVAFGRDGLAHFIYPASTNPAEWAYDLRKLLRDSVP